MRGAICSARKQSFVVESQSPKTILQSLAGWLLRQLVPYASRFCHSGGKQKKQYKQCFKASALRLAPL